MKHEEANSEAEQTFNRLKTQLQEAEQTINRLKTQLQEMEQSNKQLRSQLQTAEKTALQQAQKSASQTTLAVNRDAKDTEIADLRADINELVIALDLAQRGSPQSSDQQVLDLKLRLQTVQEEKASIEHKLLQSAQKDLDRDQSAASSGELRELRDNYSRIESEFARTNVKLGEMLNQNNELEEELANVIKMNQQLGQENLELRQALNQKSPTGRKK